MEYCKHGDLIDFLRKTGSLPSAVANGIFMQVLSAVESMHSVASMAHLDLKLENILLTEDYQVKLCDLGFSQSIYDRVFRSLGTDGYKGPEIERCIDEEGGYSGVLADVFALGVILFTLHFGIPPFTNTRDDRLYKLMTFRSNSSDPRLSLRLFLKSHPATKELLDANQIDYELLKLVQSMLSETPSERPQTIYEIRNNSYF